MDVITAFILGVVEGVTEFLPISSTGHLILVSKILGVEQTSFVKSFEIAIQAGAILSVMVLYWRRFMDSSVLKRLAVAFVPTAIVGLALYNMFKQYLLGSSDIVVWALIVGGLFLIAFELLRKQKDSRFVDISKISYKKCLFIGFFQSMSIIPGVSRSAASIIGGLLSGLNRETAVVFSFLLAVPTITVATGFDLLQTSADIYQDQYPLLMAGFIASFIVALAAIKLLTRFVKTNSFVPFGIYRILVGLAFLLFII